MEKYSGKLLSDSRIFCETLLNYLEHPLVLDLAAEVQVHLDHEESVPDAGEALECELQVSGAKSTFTNLLMYNVKSYISFSYCFEKPRVYFRKRYKYSQEVPIYTHQSNAF